MYLYSIFISVSKCYDISILAIHSVQKHKIRHSRAKSLEIDKANNIILYYTFILCLLSTKILTTLTVL